LEIRKHAAATVHEKVKSCISREQAIPVAQTIVIASLAHIDLVNAKAMSFGASAKSILRHLQSKMLAFNLSRCIRFWDILLNPIGFLV